MADDRDRPVLAVTAGDPCGIGPEIVLKALTDERTIGAARLLVVGDEHWMRATARRLRMRWPFGAPAASDADRRWDKPRLLDLKNVDASLLPGQISALAGRASAETIERAVELVLEGRAAAIVTAPIHKEALSLADYHDPGASELLARLTASRQVASVFLAPDFAVAILTEHLSLRESLPKVRKNRIVTHLKLLDREWQRLFRSRPRIVVSALNPHAGAGGRFGIEETREIEPAVDAARAAGLIVYGPEPADTVFVRARDGEFDLVLAMYHDQAMLPMKLLFGRRAVLLTVGLPFVRTAADHGPALDIAGKGMANPESMVQAILAAARLSG
ncbi:MAG: 4-hydroxythreonine-4-phosphate dehydrogenase PdxA [Acidobacteria bacterium]|nr:4-hydroxythreonine-4-phosphate dehydrogenase PdxA [Acidobacteriota bacterium]